MIEFRWIVILALWTLLIGPIVDASSSKTKARTPSAPTVRPR
jgi:hypothetical protein